MTIDVIQRNGETSQEAVKQEKPAPKYWDPLQQGVKWIERYAEPLEKFFERLPEFISTFVATLAVFTFGSILRGEWVIILVTALKQISGHTQSNQNITTEEIFSLFTEQNLKMENFGIIFIGAHVVSLSMYFLIGGFLHWYFYVKRRNTAKEWKIQPDKWLSPELERHEIMVGTFALLITGSCSALLACYIFNGNPSTVYFQFDEYGWLWFFLQFPVIFIYSDYTTYIMHRMYHTPWLYKNFHKLHHKYKQPTAFSVTAIHPVEITHIQLTMCLPLFTIPVHWLSFYSVALYIYYHGIIDHSGINFKAQWWQPWQPDADFHDKHHEFFHCNFGFNMVLWDKLHGTMRKQNRLYTEDTYHGEAPLLDSIEAKELINKDEDAKEAFISTKALLNSKSD
ncbi:methylsterol monooxygenase 2-2-like isoform X2 [Hyposmocoma kahamanoa]|uniref:methylsterol monooxygenase 2-2-like isoform X2 n=1 Tax=Hyposmocoma kahamanoa TaxID=1477025 RepID=UPI000E6D767A|nr:methylsterol monooxygenase 2-2-like isoform X2 [Hyposmocoma kahamanoa]